MYFALQDLIVYWIPNHANWKYGIFDDCMYNGQEMVEDQVELLISMSKPVIWFHASMYLIRIRLVASSLIR